MFYWLYERMLLSQIQELPPHICFMISGADLIAEPGKCLEVTGWCSELNTLLAQKPRKEHVKTPPAIQSITIHINQLSQDELTRTLPAIKKISTVARLVLHHGSTEKSQAQVSMSWLQSGKVAGKRSQLHPKTRRKRYPAIGDP